MTQQDLDIQTPHYHINGRYGNKLVVIYVVISSITYLSQSSYLRACLSYAYVINHSRLKPTQLEPEHLTEITAGPRVA